MSLTCSSVPPVQAQHAQFKQESEERISTVAAEAEELRSQLGEAQQAAAKAEREQREATAALHAREEELAAELTRSKARRTASVGLRLSRSLTSWSE